MYTVIGDNMKRFEISDTNYRIKNILVMSYSPRIRKCTVEKRIKSSLLYVQEGVYRYIFNNSFLMAEKGDVVYIPQGASYTYEVISETTFCTQTEFNLYYENNDCEEQLCFSDQPLILKNTQSGLLFGKLSGTYFRNDFMTYSVIYEMLAVYFGQSHSSCSYNAMKKICPATDHIMQNLCKPIYISELAELCGISEVHLRRLFKNTFGVSPVKYRNRLLIKYACELLASGEMNVSEIADMLGFPDIYTFSQAFKKEVGVSPKKYMVSFPILP